MSPVYIANKLCILILLASYPSLVCNDVTMKKINSQYVRKSVHKDNTVIKSSYLNGNVRDKIHVRPNTGSTIQTHQISCPTSCKCSKGGSVIDCSYAQLKKFPDPQSFPAAMQKLKINNNQILDLCLSVNGSQPLPGPLRTGIHYISAGYNSATHACPSQLRAQTVDLSYNRLSQLHWNSSIVSAGTSPISALYLNNNVFSTMPSVLVDSYLHKLNKLDLSSNYLQHATIPDKFGPFIELQQLRLQRNGIIVLAAKDFANIKLQALQDLDLLGNKISRIDKGAFTPLKSLGKLILSNNKFKWETLPTSLEALEGIHIQQLFLASNRLANGNTDGSGLANRQKDAKPPFAALANSNLTSLDLSQNQFTSISANMFSGLRDLENINLDENKLKTIAPNAFKQQKKLTLIDLQRNKLTVLDESWFQGPMSSKLVLKMTGNPFTCNCQVLKVFTDMMKKGFHFEGYERPDAYRCASPPSATTMTVAEFLKHCGSHVHPRSTPVWIIGVATGCSALFIATLILVGLLIKSRHSRAIPFEPLAPAPHNDRNINIYVNANAATGGANQVQNQCVQTDQNAFPSEDFHAFVSYDSSDRDWVLTQLQPVIEEQRGLKICIADRDFHPGKSIFDNINEAIQSSRKVLLVITNSFIRSRWCSYEVKTALVKAQQEADNAVVMVVLETLEQEIIPPVVRNLMETTTYMQYPNDQKDKRVFWDRLYEVLH